MPSGEAQSGEDAPRRRFGGSRLHPRTPAPPITAPGDVEVLDTPVENSEPSGDAPWGEGLFRGGSTGGGRIRVVGCSPGCLFLSLAISLVLTLLLNALLHVF